MANKIPQLPLDFDLETKAIRKKTSATRSTLDVMKGATTKNNIDLYNLLQYVNK